MVISFIYFLFILSLFYFVRVILFALDHSTSAGVGGWGVFALVFTTHINFFDPYFMVKFRVFSFVFLSFVFLHNVITSLFLFL